MGKERLDVDIAPAAQVIEGNYDYSLVDRATVGVAFRRAR